jgi:hypothetical protein
MDEIESQIAKIQLGNNKTSSSFVYIMAEKASGSAAEIYVVAELPLFNPAAEESCERICLAIGSGLKRAYRNPIQDNSFENAISQINEELGKLASLGQTQWINKLNCILGVKDGANFNIATCGKVSAYLLRSGEYTDISCSPEQSHPLKTFENYAGGKIRLGDLLILSTTQMFNYLSMDRLLNIVSDSPFLTASQTVLELLKETAEPQVSFAVLLNLQAPVGEIGQDELDLENYIVERPSSSPSFFTKIYQYIKHAFSAGKTSMARTPQTALPQVSFGQRLKDISGNTKNLAVKGKAWWQVAKTSAQNAKDTVKKQNFRGLSPQKKFFLISAAVLLIAVVANIAIARHISKTKATDTQVSTQLKNAQTLLANVEASLLYKDDASAAQYYAQAKAQMPNGKNIPSSDKDLYNQTVAQLNNAENLMEKIVQVKVTDLGALGKGDNLIKLPQFVAVQVNKDIISYNKQSGAVEDAALNSQVAIVNSAYIGGNTAAIYDGSNLYVWDFSVGKLSPGFNQNVPAQTNFAGIAYYPTNSRVYLTDKKAGEVISFLPGNNGFSKPVISVQSPILNQAEDLTIDGSIYILTKSGISKFQSGQPAPFTLALPTPFSGSGKIYTQKDFNYIYLLDSGNNSILILDKKGNLVNTLKSADFTNLKDFQVDEANKVMYVLNGGDLLKVTLP